MRVDHHAAPELLECARRQRIQAVMGRPVVPVQQFHAPLCGYRAQQRTSAGPHIHRAHAVGRTRLVRIVGKALHVNDQPRDVRCHRLRRREAIAVQRVGEPVSKPQQLRVERVAIHHEVTACVVGDAGGGVRDVQEEWGAEHAYRERWSSV